MVSTRQHPSDFPSPEDAAKQLAKSSPAPTTNGAARKWVYTPSAALTVWLVVSVPLVIWDTGYVLLRPHSMPGGSLHSPIWIPYALYGSVDYIYGWPAWNERNGFTAAQSVMNVFETLGYLYYLWIVYHHGATVVNSRGDKKLKKGMVWLLTGDKVVAGRTGATALLVAFIASVMTLSKTALYWLNEYFSDFENIGHNTTWDIIFLWAIPKYGEPLFPKTALHLRLPY
ncbi:hypothetical protein POX_e06776 [Penicillium oxalicum]|uniref:hypothetical protein n=1 Tax=Penicillium oxalicum TaxID=69781 RepID=UPI0020B812F4|nr:hypothetical protein POX_e06776 [Penicillium oxalicum]KAI2788755.1 hypothetical protein POX_e06776 [Penicillium oxalicum]